MRWPVRLVAILVVGCASAPPPPAELAPATDGDPEPWVAPPSAAGETSSVGDTRAVGETGATISLAMAGGRDEARALTLRFLGAVRDADEVALTQLLEDPLSRAQPRPSSPHLARTQVLELVLRSPRRADLGPDVALDELAQLEGIEVRPLSEAIAEPPRGLAATDLFVTIPLTTRGRAILRFLVPGWHLRGALILRSTPIGWRIVGL